VVDQTSFINILLMEKTDLDLFNDYNDLLKQSIEITIGFNWNLQK